MTRLLAVLIACATCLGCGATTTTAPPQTIRVNAQGAPATNYETAVPAGAAVLGSPGDAVQSIVEEALQASGRTLTPDPRLAQLAQLALDEVDRTGRVPPSAVIDLWAHHLGLFEPAPHVVLLGVGDLEQAREALHEDVASMLPRLAYTHWGAAAHEREGVRLLLVLSWRWAELEPIPSQLQPGETLHLRGTLLEGYADPELVVTTPDGSSRRAPAGKGRAVDHRTRLTATGHYRVELLATGEHGITVVANVPLAVGVAPLTSVDVPDESFALEPEDAEVALLDLINAERQRVGLPALQRHATLDDVARAHVRDMQESDFVGHTSPNTGPAAGRVERAGVRTRLVLENIGRGETPAKVHADLMRSPGHRANIISREATHVGIGVARDDHEGMAGYLATEVFVRLAQRIDLEAAPEASHEVIDAARKRRRLDALDEDATLTKIAAAAAKAFFREGVAQDVLARRTGAQAKAARPPYASMGALIVLVDSLDELAQVDALLDPKATAAGIGVAQGTRADTARDAIVVVVLLGYGES
jgi:uncharacterized protein YkwD